MRKVAAHVVEVEGQPPLRLAVVEISGHEVVRYYPFTDEQPMTEWLGGTITITSDRRAWHNGLLLIEE